MLILVSSITVYADDSISDNVNLLGLTEEDFDNLYDDLLNEAEKDLSRPRWLVLTKGYSWKREPSTSDVAQPEVCYRMSMKIVATRVYITKDGYKLYSLEGTITNAGKTWKVYGVAILDKHGCFCMKLDGEEALGFRLFGCGRISAGHGVIRLQMKGRFELNGVHFGFIQRGYAKRLRVSSLSETL
jgi:hypothetical protein